MEYRSLGRTGVQVGNPCFGTMTFGWDPHDWGSTEEDSIRLVDHALSLGINFFDTADIYARGVSETILGKALKGKWDKVVLATKCHGRMDDTDPNAWGNTRRHVVMACEASLKRLGCETIDLYQIHRPQPSVPIEETLRGLDDLVRAGKVRYVGCSTFAAWQVCEAHYIAKQLGVQPFVSEQPPLNLLDRRIERELLPFCQTYDLAVIPWSPLAGGQLTGKYLEPAEAKGARYGSSDPAGRVNEKTTEVVRRLKGVADQAGITLTQLSLAWVAGHAGVTCPIIGARSEKQLEESVAACQIKLDEATLEAIDAIVAPGTHVAAYYEANFGPNARGA